MMRRLTPLVVAIIFVLGIGVTAIAVAVTRFGDGRGSAVYTVAQVVQGVSRDPAHWYGRTVAIQARAFAAYLNGSAVEPGMVRLVDTGTGLGAPADTIWVKYGPENRILALARRLPFIGSLMPGRQRVIRYAPAVYEVHLRASPDTCVRIGCLYTPRSELVDAAPPAW